ncbi:carbohydrate kinase [Sphingobacterium ginsenosidimutans]
MKNLNKSIQGVCFGEVLWDNLPTGKKLGGAPLNVAYHLNKLGVVAQMLTRIGRDENGYELLTVCEQLGIPTAFFQYDDSLPTSTVEVTIDADRNVQYDIVYPVAWDRITAEPALLEAVSKADFLVYGSLACRDDVSFQSLLTLLKEACFRVMDVNLRAPFFAPHRVHELLRYADLVKMNAEELHIIAEWSGAPSTYTDQQRVDLLLDCFSIQEAIVTYGAAGAVYHHKKANISYHFPALKVQVEDTIGSGDSFLAAFLTKRFQMAEGVALEEVLEFAATLSGFVTQSSGACPAYNAADINRFHWLNPIFRDSERKMKQ